MMGVSSRETKASRFDKDMTMNIEGRSSTRDCRNHASSLMVSGTTPLSSAPAAGHQASTHNESRNDRRRHGGKTLYRYEVLLHWASLGLLLALLPTSTVCQQISTIKEKLPSASVGQQSPQTARNATLETTLHELTNNPTALLDFASDPDFEAAMRRGATPHSCNGQGDKFCGNAHLVTRCPDVCAQRVCQRNPHHNLFNLIIDEGRYDYVYIWDKDVCITSCREEPWRGVCAPGAGLWINGDFYCTALDCSYTIEPAVSGCHQARDFFQPNCAACNRLFPSACQYSWPPPSQPASQPPRKPPPSKQEPSDASEQDYSDSPPSSEAAASDLAPAEPQKPDPPPAQPVPAEPDYSRLPKNNRPDPSSETTHTDEEVIAPKVEVLPPLNMGVLPGAGSLPGVPQVNELPSRDPVTIKDLVFAVPPADLPPVDGMEESALEFLANMNNQDPVSGIGSASRTPVEFDFLLEPTVSHEDAGARLILRSIIAEVSGLAQWQVKQLLWQPTEPADLRATASTTDGPPQRVSGAFDGLASRVAGTRLKMAASDGKFAKILEMAGLVYIPGSLSVEANGEELELQTATDHLQTKDVAEPIIDDASRPDLGNVKDNGSISSSRASGSQSTSPMFIAMVCLLSLVVVMAVAVAVGVGVWFLQTKKSPPPPTTLATRNVLYSPSHPAHRHGNPTDAAGRPYPVPPPPSPAAHLMPPQHQQGRRYPAALMLDDNRGAVGSESRRSSKHVPDSTRSTAESLAIVPDPMANPDEIQMMTVAACLDPAGYGAPYLPQRQSSSRQRWIDLAPNPLATLDERH